MKEPNLNAPLIDFQIEDVWPILRKQRQIIFLFLGTVLITTLIGGLLRTKEYRATALIHLTPRPGQEMATNEVVDFQTRGYFEVQQFFRTQIQYIMSRSVREEVVGRYNALGHSDLLLDDNGSQALLGMMTVVPTEQSQLIDIHVTHTDPALAALLANLIAEVYSDTNLAVRQDASSEATTWLGEEITSKHDEVETLRAALFSFKDANHLVDVDEGMNTLNARFTALNEVYGKKSTEAVVARTTLSGHERLLKRGAFDELAKALSSPLLDAVARDYAGELAKQADISTTYGEKHPERVQSKAKLDAIRNSMISEVRRIINGERATFGVLESEVESLRTEIDSVKSEMLAWQLQKSEYDALRTDLDRSEAMFAKLSGRLDEVELSSRTQLNNVAIVDVALAPTVPYKPNIPMSMAVSLVVGVIGGVGLGLLREYVDDTITSQVDVTTHLKVPFLGLIPRLPEGVQNREADLFTHYNPRSAISEAVRGLRAMLEMNPNGPPPRRILVTSSVAREGKTSTTMRLGVSFAQMGRKVVVVDADLRRPRVHKVFAADNRVGLSSYLIGVADMKDLPQPTVVPNLYAIYSGSGTDHPAELMASNKMEELLTELEESFDIILIDTPPSVALSDAVTLSRRVDGILLVVKEQSVSRVVVKQTIDLMKQVEANILGVVLNNVDLQRAGSKYKYYHAYRDYYSYYSPDEKIKTSEDSDQAAK